MKRLPWVGLVVLSLAVASGGCNKSSSGVNGGDGDGGLAGGSSEDGAVDDEGDPGSGGPGGGDGGPGSGGPGGGNGGPGSGGPLEEVCDGTDTSGDGIIDNVDKNNDGICDCLRLATLGEPGIWGNGDIFSEWLDERSDNGATHLGNAEITFELLQGFHVVVLQDLSTYDRTYSAAEVEALHRFVREGGGLMTLIGYADVSELANVNLLLEPMDLRYLATPILPKNGGTTIPIEEWVDHPTTDGVQGVGVDNGYPVAGSGTVIATRDGHDIALVKEVEEGRVFMWGDEWITYDSEWSDDAGYQVERFWLNIIKWLTPENECQVEIPEILI